MTYWSRIAVAGCLLGGAVVACSSGSVGVIGPDYGEPPVYVTGNDGGITGDGAASEMPMLAKIDPSATMIQTPGKGVGVFTQYDPSTEADPGGHWYVWWTCDTLTSNEPCDFDISVSVAHGDISNTATQGFADTDSLTGGGGEAGAAASQSFTAQAYTTTTVQGVHFDTDPGAIITLSASLGGEYSGSFLFFVQDNKVNGGYTGMLSDPIELQSSAP